MDGVCWLASEPAARCGVFKGTLSFLDGGGLGVGKEPGQGSPVWAYPVSVTRSLVQGAFDSQDVFSSADIVQFLVQDVATDLITHPRTYPIAI